MKRSQNISLLLWAVIVLLLGSIGVRGWQALAIGQGESSDPIFTNALVALRDDAGTHVVRVADREEQLLPRGWQYVFAGKTRVLGVGTNPGDEQTQRFAFLGSQEKSELYQIASLPGFIVDVSPDPSGTFMLVHGIKPDAAKGYVCSAHIRDLSLHTCADLITRILEREDHIIGQPFQMYWTSEHGQVPKARVVEMAERGRIWSYTPSTTGKDVLTLEDEGVDVDAFIQKDRPKQVSRFRIQQVGPIVRYTDLVEGKTWYFRAHVNATFIPLDAGFVLALAEDRVDVIDIEAKTAITLFDQPVPVDVISTAFWQRSSLQ